jgi:sulfate adenylyltransferase
MSSGVATKLVLSARELSDVALILNGAFAPLEGFLGRADYASVVSDLRLTSGAVWSLPVTLSVAREDAPPLDETVELIDEAGTVRALLDVTDVFAYDKAAAARNVYRTEDAAHPGVAVLYAQKDVLVGGRVRPAGASTSGVPATGADALALTPQQTKAEFARRGWKTIVGFQTRNPVHRAHEYIQKSALEIVDGLLLHPLVGETKSDDIPADVRLRCYEALLEGYFPPERVLLATLPAAMRYAGPREAIFHALVRKNYGCTHFIVGRDHAGVGNYYGTYDAQALFDTFTPAELGITWLKYENSFFCRRCDAMATRKTCPHPPESHVALSGTAVRDLLRSGQLPPPEFSRPEVARILIEALA